MWVKVKMIRFSCVAIVAIFCSHGYSRVTGYCYPEFDLPCNWKRFSGDDCTSDKLLEKFPFYGTNNTTEFSKQSLSFESEASFRRHANGNWYPAVNLTFTLHDVEKIHLKGFEVIRNGESNSVTCYILDLSNVTWDEKSRSEIHTMFWLDLFPLNPNPYPLYRLELYKLPKVTNKDPSDLFVEFPGYRFSNAERSHDWRAITSLSRNFNNRSINVTIARPPDIYGFMLFSYMLVDNSSNDIIQAGDSRQQWYEFKDVASGVYKIWITPVRDGNKCPCHVDNVCHRCSTTETRAFIFENSTKSVPFTVSSTISQGMETTTDFTWLSTMSDVSETKTDMKEERNNDRSRATFHQLLQILQLTAEGLKQGIQQEKELFSLKTEALKNRRKHDFQLFKLKKRLLSRNIVTALDEL